MLSNKLTSATIMLLIATKMNDPQSGSENKSITSFQNTEYFPLNTTLPSCVPEDKGEAILLLQKQQKKQESTIKRQITPNVTPDFIASRIKGGTQLRRDEIAAVVNQVINIHPVISNYINLVLTQLPDFQIGIYPRSEIIAAGAEAGYCQASQVMVMPDEFPKEKPITVIKDTILHEFRHAAMDTIHTTFGGNPRSTKTKNYFPITEQEKSNMEAVFAKGDREVENLKQLLIKEVMGEIKQNDKTQLSKLRQTVMKEYLEFYQKEMNLVLSKNTVAWVEKYGTKLSPGVIINFDKDAQRMGLTMSGNLRIKEMWINPDRPDFVSFRCLYLDPLFAAIDSIHDQIKEVKRKYSSYDYLEERDAHLFGRIPVPIIEYLYPELVQYTNNLVNQARVMPVNRMKRNIKKLSHIEMMIERVANIMALSENFEAENAIHYLKWAELLVSVDKVDDARSGLKELIQRGHYVGEANLVLGRIEYGEQNYSVAAKLFKRAQKRQVAFTLADQEHFAESLFHDKQFKAATKQQNLAKRQR